MKRFVVVDVIQPVFGCTWARCLAVRGFERAISERGALDEMVSVQAGGICPSLTGPIYSTSIVGKREESESLG